MTESGPTLIQLLLALSLKHPQWLHLLTGNGSLTSRPLPRGETNPVSQLPR
jgi:hypothetical protein